MFTSAQNELQLRQNNSESTNGLERRSDPCDQHKVTQIKGDGVEVPYVFFSPPRHYPLTILPRGITRKDVDIIKLTAQFMAVYGTYFRMELVETVFKDPELEPHFAFLKRCDHGSKDIFYGDLALGYSRVLVRSIKVKEKDTSTATILVGGFLNFLHQLLGKLDENGLDMSLFDLHVFEYFFNMEYPPPSQTSQVPQGPLKFPSLPQGIPITHKELDIIKLTAQFVAVYGNCFEQDLIKSVFTKPELEPLFQFMLSSTDSMHEFYSQLVHGYTSMLLWSHKGASTETLLKGYFNIVQQVLDRKKEEGPEMAIVDLHAFQYFVEVEYTDWQPPIPGLILSRLHPHRQMQHALGSKFAHINGMIMQPAPPMRKGLHHHLRRHSH